MDIRVEHWCLLEWLCKTKGSWDYSLLNLSALSAVLLLLDSKPETLIQAVKWEFSLAASLQFYLSCSCFQFILSCSFCPLQVFFPHSWRYCSCHSIFVFLSSYVTGSLPLYHEGHGLHLWEIVTLQSLFTADLTLHKDFKITLFMVLHIAALTFFPVSNNDSWTPLRQLMGPNKPRVSWGQVAYMQGLGISNL